MHGKPTMSDPGDAVRQLKGYDRTKRTLRINGTMLIVFAPLMLVIGLVRAVSASDVLIGFAGFGLLLVAGLAARRCK
jgi:hypothetical protein